MTDFQTALHQAAAQQDHSQFRALIQHCIHGIDRLCSAQLQQVLHHQMVFTGSGEYDELYTATRLAELGEVSLCPVITGTDPHFTGDDLHWFSADHNRISRILNSPDYYLWQKLRCHEQARFLYLALPRFLLRYPHKTPHCGFVYQPDNHPGGALWGNAAWLVVMNVICEFERISWFGFLRSYNGSGTQGAIVAPLTGGDALTPAEIITETDLACEQDNFWAEQGLTACTSLYLSGQYGFFSYYSVWQPPEPRWRQLTILPVNLMACRFAHAIRTQIRDKIGNFDSLSACQRSIEKWLKRYVSDVDYGEDAIMADYPLRRAAVVMSADPARYQCRICLQPQYQYDISEANVDLTLWFSRPQGEVLS
nr:type VI secretion system contractile sheath large subunit [Morganella morganii]